MQINQESIFVLLAAGILYNVAAEETVFYCSLAVNASINAYNPSFQAIVQ